MMHYGKLDDEDYLQNVIGAEAKSADSNRGTHELLSTKSDKSYPLGLGRLAELSGM